MGKAARPRDLVLDLGAVYRLSRLVTTDALTRPARERAIARAYGSNEELAPREWTARVHDDPSPPKLAKLITCWWCASIWVAFAVVVARRVSPRLWSLAAEALAFSAATGIASDWLEVATQPTSDGDAGEA